MKGPFLIAGSLIALSFLHAEPSAQPGRAVPIAPQAAPLSAEPSVPADLDARLKGAGLNWLQVRVNQSVARIIREKKVSLEELNEYLYLMAVPNFAYRGDAGEERLGNDMMGLLGTIKTGEDVEIMEMQWSEMAGMGLPFRKRIIDALLFPPDYFKDAIDLTFFVNMHVLTARIGAALSVRPGIKPLYNSQQKFYRLKKESLQFIYIVNIPNVAYEMVYTGEPLENVIKKYLQEVDLLFPLLERYEKRILSDKTLSYDGRYVKGKNVFIDLWFLHERIKGSAGEAEALLEKALKHQPVEVSGSEKKGNSR
ncbi:MAG TPA: hypothetical protein PKH10_03225 [bacterium]|nr:hypothetical protein [bacterium]